MYNRNYGGFDYVRIHSELLTSVLNRILTHINPQLTIIQTRYASLFSLERIKIIILTLVKELTND